MPEKVDLAYAIGLPPAAAFSPDRVKPALLGALGARMAVMFRNARAWR